MRVWKTIKKIAALGIGASMLGATILGASAYTLADYPSPFITEGKFDGLIVVGTNAAASDVLGTADIISSLQYAATKKVTVAGAAAEPVISEGAKIEKSGDKLNFGDNLTNIQDTPLTDSDLPDLLKDGTYEDSEGNTDNTETYTQEILLNGYDQFVFEADDDGDELAADYLKFTNNKLVYTYKLEFDDNVDYDNSSSTSAAQDIENTELTIQGNLYTITDAKATGTGNSINELTLQAGETLIWLEEGVDVTKTVDGVDHTVSLTDVNEAEDKCGISVDGTVAWVDKGSTKTISGVTMGVVDAITVHTAGKDTDVCEVNIGAAEIKLKDSDEVNKDGKDIDNSQVNFLGTPGKWLGFNVTYTAEDDEYIKSGDEFVDKIFGNFMFRYAGTTATTEEITFTRSGDTAEFSFLNSDGKTVEVPLKMNDSIAILGKDFDEPLLTEGIAGYDCETTAAAQDDCEGVLLWVVTSGEVPHIIEISNINTAQNETDFKDLTDGVTYSDKSTAFDTVQSFSLGSLGTIQLNLTATGLITTTDLQLDQAAETKYGAQIVLQNSINATGSLTQNATINMTEENDETNEYRITLATSPDASNDEIDLKAPTFTAVGANANYQQGAISESDTNTDDKWYATEWGTIIDRDSDEGGKKITITYPDEQLFGNVFVAPISATVSEAGTSESVVVEKINVGAAVLADEVQDVKAQNLIVVGGPCANDVANTLMGNPEACYTACGDNAVLKLVENDGKSAILVCGKTADDTRRASRVLANYKDYALTGTEVEVSGTSLTEISVSAPTS